LPPEAEQAVGKLGLTRISSNECARTAVSCFDMLIEYARGQASRVTGSKDCLRIRPWFLTRLLLFVAVGLAVLPLRTPAQTDEIQVYDAEIAEPGVFNLMVHTNFTPIGRTAPDFPGAIIANNSVNGAAEWAYGVKPWFEQGLYLPVYSFYSKDQGATLNGFKIRELFVRPHAQEHKFFYGLNFEFSVNALYWESRRITSEFRPIVGVHLGRWDVIYNPILDTDYTGGVKGLEYNPAGRVAYNLSEKWAVALEEYDGFGRLREFVPSNQQFHETWAVVDRRGGFLNVETGVGVGWSGGADRLTFKLMLSRDLNSHAH
jgi:hypothetical protein